VRPGAWRRTWQAKRAGAAAAVTGGPARRGVVRRPGRARGPRPARAVAPLGPAVAPLARAVAPLARAVAPLGPAVAPLAPVVARLGLAVASLARDAGRLAPAAVRLARAAVPLARVAARQAGRSGARRQAAMPALAVPDRKLRGAVPARRGPSGRTARFAGAGRALARAPGRGTVLLGIEGLVRPGLAHGQATRPRSAAVQRTGRPRAQTGPRAGPGPARAAPAGREPARASRAGGHGAARGSQVAPNRGRHEPGRGSRVAARPGRRGRPGTVVTPRPRVVGQAAVRGLRRTAPPRPVRLDHGQNGRLGAVPVVPGPAVPGLAAAATEHGPGSRLADRAAGRPGLATAGRHGLGGRSVVQTAAQTAGRDAPEAGLRRGRRARLTRPGPG
jgi:hypothetical protein